MKSLKSALFAGVAAVALVAAGAASAATISFSFTNPQQTTEINQSNTLSLFNPALGTLTNVSLSVTGTATTQLEFINNAAQAQDISATATVNISFTNSNGIVVPPVSIMIPTGVITVQPGGAGSATFGPVTQSASAIVNAPPLPLAAFIGLGDITVTCVSLSGLTILGGGGNVVANQSTTAGCGAEVIYTFTTEPPAVPAPASLALLGAGLLGLGLARRRRNVA